jgi:hypothetical protein
MKILPAIRAHQPVPGNKLLQSPGRIQSRCDPSIYGLNLRRTLSRSAANRRRLRGPAGRKRLPSSACATTQRTETMMPTAVRRVTAIHPPCSTFESDGAQSNPDLAAKVLGALVRLFQMYLLGDAALPHDHPGAELPCRVVRERHLRATWASVPRWSHDADTSSRPKNALASQTTRLTAFGPLPFLSGSTS